jgi:hypothetical protein
MYVGIIGRERVGKDTFADILVTEYGFKKHSMAEPIRDIAHIIFPHWQNPMVEKDVVDSVSGIRPRDFMKWLGTDIFQIAFHEKFPNATIRPRCIWSSICGDRICADSSSNWVIPDIRFKHEAEELQRLGGILINLYNDSSDSHCNSSNQSSYDIPFILENFQHVSICNKHDGIDKLKTQVHEFMTQNS